MKLWGGRFTKETNQLVHNFNASISYDQKFYKQDILGSIAHVTMLEKQGILTTSEKDAIVDGLHLKATAIGRQISCQATITQVEGRKISLEIEAWDEKGKIGSARHDRFIIDPERFMAKL